MAAISAWILARLSGLAPKKESLELCELAVGLREGLDKFPGLLYAQPVRVTDNEAALSTRTVADGRRPRVKIA